MKRIHLLITILVTSHAFAQHEDTGYIHQHPDTLSIGQAFKKGKVHGHFRYFYMATDNKKGLTDYHANALGGGLKYESAPFHKLQLGISGYFIYNMGSSDLSYKDPLTQQLNRYEIGLFDLEDTHNKSDIDRLEELYLKYTNKQLSITFGKQLINTPFIKPQDSRMRPTEVEGIYGNAKLKKNWNVEGGWISKVSPRSTVKWYAVAESIGINSQGVNRDGSVGNYKYNLESKGIGLLGIIFKSPKGLQLKVYDQFVDNMFNSSFIQADYEKLIGNNKAKAAFQYIRQDVINKGGNIDPLKTYFDKSNKVNVFGARVAWEQKHWETSFNYSRITKHGRFTMPREWGTEPFFTYLSRERNEGLGDVNAIMVMAKGKLPEMGVKLELGYGHYYLPGVENALLNKYKMPSYRHLKALADYEFKGALEGLDIALLWIYKGQLGKNVYAPKYLINKVDMSSFNVIMNYHF